MMNALLATVSAMALLATGGGSPIVSPTVTASKWRFNAYAAWGSTNRTSISLRNVNLYNGDGVKIDTSGGTASGSSTWGSPYSAVWSGDPAASISSPTDGVFPCWYEVDMPAPITVSGYEVVFNAESGSQPSIHNLAYYDEGSSSWKDFFPTRGQEAVAPADGSISKRTFGADTFENAAHRYWRLIPSCHLNTSYHGFSGIGLVTRSGEIVTRTRPVTVGPTAGLQAGSVADCLNAEGDGLAQWYGLADIITFDFGVGAAFNIDEWFIYPNKDDAGNRTPYGWRLQFSDDGTTYTTKGWGQGADGWTSGVKKRFILPDYRSGGESFHAAWGSTHSIGDNISFSEIDLRKVASGVNQIAPTDVTYAWTNYSGLPSSQGIDGNIATFWSSNGYADENYFIVGTRANFLAKQMVLSSRADSDQYANDQTPTLYEIGMGGPNAFRYIGTATLGSGWTAGQTKSVPILGGLVGLA